jgi:hypothetical protein
MRKVGLGMVVLVGSLTASSAVLAAHGGSASHSLASPSLSISHANPTSSTAAELRTFRTLRSHAGLSGLGSNCNMLTYPADRNCQ